MNYYQEITLLPDTEISLGFIWQHVFQQVHIALVEHKTDGNFSKIAISFPQYQADKFSLGNKLRLFAEDMNSLEALSITKWLERLSDYAHVKSIQQTPESVSYVIFERKHVKSPARIEKDMRSKAERYASQSGKTIEECLVKLEKTKPETSCKLPFVYLYSQETKQRSPDKNSKFPLFIQKIETSRAESGKFDCYGLSAKSNGDGERGTVPQF
ncbi:MAG: type I-F CRISPR-associated endoribonuclease Cas6/Csy4 [Vibrio sp.]